LANSFLLAFVLIIGFALAAIIHSYKINQYIESTKFFKEKIEKLRYCDEKLSVLTLEKTILLHENDNSIDKLISTIHKHIDDLKNKKIDSFTMLYLDEFLELLIQKEKYAKLAIQAAKNINNTTVGIQALQFNIRESVDLNIEEEKKLLFLSNSTLLAILTNKDFKNTDQIPLISQYINVFEAMKFENNQLNEYKEIAKFLYNDYITNQTIYIDSLHNAFEIQSQYIISLLEEHFDNNAKNGLSNLNTVSILFVVIFIITIISILFLLDKTNKDNKRLNIITKTLEFNSKYDKLTGLLNRNSFNELVKIKDYNTFVLFNIDNFKDLNDFYGFDVGDSVLYKVANRLKLYVAEFFPQDSQVFRLGGDDFGVLIKSRTKNSTYNSLVYNFLTQISETTFGIKGFKIRITISASISNKGPLLQTADAAMKILKKKKNNKYIVYSSDLNVFEKSNKNFEFTHKLIHALEENGIKPYFQPIVDANSGKIVKYEALVRLIEPDGTVLTPNLFLDISKQIREYKFITQTMFLKSFNIFLDRDEDLSINISYEDIIDKDTETFIENQFIIFPELGPRVTFEILETDSVDDYNKVYIFIDKFKAYGCKFAIDDFGSGYSNFEQVLKMKADFLKIDGSLIKDLEKDPNARIVVETIVSFAKKTGLQTIAEFVSNEEIDKILDEIGVDYKQGFYYGKPIALGKTKKKRNNDKI
jgi:diguanylate cyclase (GGDEF)-like protein